MTDSSWKGFWQRRRYDIAIVASIALFFVAFFPHVLFGNTFIITGDAYYAAHPMRTEAWNMIRSGHLPMWTPSILGGYPLLSMAQVAIGYPLTWSYLILPGPWAEQIYVLAPYLLSPMFTYAYAREIGRTRLAGLLAGLAFGYGGMMCGFISNSGILTNSLMWTPLVLLFVDRAQRRPIVNCLPQASLIYALSVLAGHPQSYVYAGTLIAAYGFFLALFPTSSNSALLSWQRWRPFFVAVGGIVIAAGVAAFQLLESLRAARRSIRSELTYARFSEGSYSLREAVLSLGAPLYHYVDTSPYVTPLALMLAVFAIALYSHRQDRSDLRVWFWLLVASVSFLLLLGSNTPLHRVAYLVPVLKQFRVPSRHTFEFTLSISILAAFGWDWIIALVKTKSEQTAHKRDIVVAFILLATSIVIGGLWWKATSRPPAPHPTIYTGLSESSYWLWKISFTTATVLLIAWCALKINSSTQRTALLGASILITCFAEPAATISCWWGRQLSLSAARLQLVSPTTRLLQQFPSSQNRVYTRTELFTDEFKTPPRIESPNLHVLHGLHNIAGIEPLVLERFSRALGGVGPDAVTPLSSYPSNNDDIFSARSHVLDLLNTTHVVSFTNLKTFEDPEFTDAIRSSAADVGAVAAPLETVKLNGPSAPADQLVLVTSLANSVDVPQGTDVARIHLKLIDGSMKAFSMRAGIDTAEWAHDRPDVKTVIKHENAQVFDSRPGDEANSFPANRYLARFNLPGVQVVSVEIENLSTHSSIAIWRAALYDTTKSLSFPALRARASEFWQVVYSEDHVEVRQNTRALPRAWLVAEARAVDGEWALREIRGEGDSDFDPRRTALLEVPPAELPSLPGGKLSPDSTVRITNYEPNRIRYETKAPTATILVASEVFYPGWTAEVDGQRVPILLTDFLLRGVNLPPGEHVVEMRYTATAARNGSLISVPSLGIICALFLIGRRKTN